MIWGYHYFWKHPCPYTCNNRHKSHSPHQQQQQHHLESIDSDRPTPISLGLSWPSPNSSPPNLGVAIAIYFHSVMGYLKKKYIYIYICIYICIYMYIYICIPGPSKGCQMDGIWVSLSNKFLGFQFSPIGGLYGIP